MTPPTPGPGFIWVDGRRPYLQCTALAEIAAHAFTTRDWIDGPASPASLDVLWRRTADSIGVEPGHLARVQQVHGAGVIAATEAAARLCQGDAVIGDDPGLAVAVQTADCVPILMAARRGGCVAAVHVGWRGIAAGALAAAVQALARRGVDPADLVAAIGPAIGPCCYEVGADVVDAMRAAVSGAADGSHGGRDADAWFLDQPATLEHNRPSLAPPRPGYWCFDTWGAVRWQLLRAGLRADRIFVAALCTASHPEWFCSYRREGKQAGRMAAVIRRGPSRQPSGS
jgi:YfiH family protein